jgi:hypothetical protein
VARHRKPIPWLRSSVKSIHRLAKGIRDGTRVPSVTLSEIGHIADSNRRRLPDGTLEPVEQSPIWPVYGPLHAVRLRWNDLQARGALTPELADDLQAEMYEAAYAILGESRSHRDTTALVMYEKGRLRAAHGPAVGMSNFIVGIASGRLDQAEPLITVSTVDADPPTDVRL